MNVASARDATRKRSAKPVNVPSEEGEAPLPDSAARILAWALGTQIELFTSSSTVSRAVL